MSDEQKININIESIVGKPAAAGENPAWPLEAERVSLDDPLMECLAIVAAGYAAAWQPDGLARRFCACG